MTTNWKFYLKCLALGLFGWSLWLSAAWLRQVQAGQRFVNQPPAPPTDTRVWSDYKAIYGDK